MIFTGFTAVEVGGSFKVDITRSDKYSIAVTVGDKIASRLQVTKNGDTLHIGFDAIIINLHGRPSVVITMPDLRNLNISGASTGTASGFKSSNDFKSYVSGASTLDVDMQTGNFNADISGASGVSGNLLATGADLRLSGAGRITLTGSGGNANINTSGASQVNLGNYALNNADIVFSGGSSGSINVGGKLNANLSGGSRLDYSGNPTLGKINVTGGSSFKAK
jgi:hypothetical protein